MPPRDTKLTLMVLGVTVLGLVGLGMMLHGFLIWMGN
jgi:hypothetical protein